MHFSTHIVIGVFHQRPPPPPRPSRSMGRSVCMMTVHMVMEADYMYIT